MVDLALGYAFSAGMVATVNPCGAVMLPAWVSYYLSRPDSDGASRPPAAPLTQGVAAALVATLGFVTVFLGVGAVVSLGGRALLQAVPPLAIAIGAALIGVGLASLIRRGPHLWIPGAGRLLYARPGWWGVFLFGMGYAAVSTSCTLPIFLVVPGLAAGANSVLAGLALFLSYSVGMGAVLVSLTAAAAVAKVAVTRWLRRVAPYVERASAVLLIGAGGYLVMYWLPQLAGGG